MHNLEKGKHLHTNDWLDLSRLSKIIDQFAMDQLNTNDKFSYQFLSSIHQKYPYPAIVDYYANKDRVNEVIVDHLEEIRKRTLQLVDDRDITPAHKEIIKSNYNLVMDKYIKMIQFKLFFFQSHVYLDPPNNLVPNPEAYYYINKRVRDRLFVRNSPKNSEILGLLKKQIPDLIIDEDAKREA
jgi:hypothetical protein